MQVQGKTPMIYANVVNVRSTTSELILDFAYVVDPPENIVGPSELVPEVRVILAVGATRKLGQLLLKVAQQSEQSTSGQTDVAEKA
jgi:hypothetical protein